MIEVTDILVLFRLLAAHLIGDFILQPKSWIDKRRQYGLRAPQLYYHIGVVGGLTYLLLGDWSHFGLPLFILLTHLFIDWWKSSREESITAFIIDQAAHLLIIWVGWVWYADINMSLFTYLSKLISLPAVWIIFISYLLVMWPFGYFIAQLTSHWQQELVEGDSEQLSGLKRAGMWIGCLERFIILTFILLNQYGAIGFLIAAKSVFRFSGKVRKNQERKETEYILIGTLLSFALSIILGIAVLHLLQIWR